MKLVKFISILLISVFFSACCAYKIFPAGEYHCAQINFQNLVEDRKYEEAFKQLSPEGLESYTYGHKVSYDILNVLVNGRKIKKEELFIYKTFTKYPHSAAWTMLSAKILIIYLDTGKIDQETIELFEKYVPKNSKNNYFWINALKDLKVNNEEK